MISLHNVSKEYNLDDATTITPVRSVTLEIKRGEFILIIGRSGSGKTTLLNLAAGLVKPTSGKVLFEGKDIWQMSDKELSFLRARKMGFIFQFPSMLPSLRVIDNVAMPTIFAHNGKHDGYAHAEELLRMVGLTPRKDCLPRQISGGEQKRTVIARALVNRPEVILADEPTADLDEQTEHEIMALLREIHQSGVTVIMVTHSLELLPYATRALKMEDGRISELSQRDTDYARKSLR